MFYPDGFMPLSRIHASCISLAVDRFPDAADEEEFWPSLDPRAELYAELLFSRFLEANGDDLWAFSPPSTLLRVSPELFQRSRIYDGPCPNDLHDAQQALSHLAKGPRWGVTHDFRVDANPPEDCDLMEAPPDLFLELAPMHRALLCWKVTIWPIDTEKMLRQFLDQAYWRGTPAIASVLAQIGKVDPLERAYQDFISICPDGKEASGLTWDEVVKKTGYSRRQLMRAIKSCTGHEAGQGVGKCS